MRKVILAAGCLCFLALAVLPAQAFTANDLTITLDPEGNAHVNMQYQLSVPEYFAVFLRIADPARELTRALESGLNKPVTVEKFDSNSAQVTVTSFATVTKTDTEVTMTTPKVSFEQAQKVINQYWFAPLISPDFSPKVTTVIFPDGYQAGFYDQIAIPSLTHAMQS